MEWYSSGVVEPDLAIVPLGAVVVRFLQPAGGVYTRVTEHGRNERLAIVAFPDVVVAIDGILP